MRHRTLVDREERERRGHDESAEQSCERRTILHGR
jgi:hypothetical protein